MIQVLRKNIRTASMDVCIHSKMREGEFGELKKYKSKKLYKAIKVKGEALLAL